MRLRSFQTLIFVVTALLSCAEHAPAADQHPIAPMPPPIAPVDAGVPPTVALLQAADAGVDAGDETTTASTKSPIDPTAWLGVRGISAKEQVLPESAWACEEVIVGTERESALACTIAETVGRNSHKIAMDRVLEHRTVNVARAKKLVKILDAIVAVEPFDKEPRQANIVDLALHIAPDGLSAKPGRAHRICRQAMRGRTCRKS